mgnify:CR=1 FL=1
MRVVLVHHAEAVGPEVDPQRPLSARGAAQAEWLADRVKAADVVPAAVWHSGKLRARQTAERYWRTCNPLAELRMVRGLRAEDSPEGMHHVLMAEDRDVLVVSHMPMLPALLFVLAPESAAFPAHGVVVLERRDNRGFVEECRFSPQEG